MCVAVHREVGAVKAEAERDPGGGVAGMSSGSPGSSYSYLDSDCSSWPLEKPGSPPRSNCTFLLRQKLLQLALLSPSVSATLTALTARIRGEAGEVLVS